MYLNFSVLGRSKKSIFIALSLSFLLTITNAFGSDWSTWLGPHEDNTTESINGFETDLSRWAIDWETHIGRGYSAVTTYRDRVFTKGHNEASHETLYCLRIETGEVLWKHTYEAELMPRAHGGGPNASVVIDGVRLYSVSKDGQLRCNSVDTGEEIWKVRLTELLEMDTPSWGFGSTPVIHGDRLILGAGRIVSLHIQTGEVDWISKTERRASYGTPVVFNYRDETFIAAMHGNGFFILNVSTGEEVIDKRITTKSNVVSNTPLVFDGGEQIFIHTNAFSEVLRFDGRDFEIEWIDRKLQNSQSAAVIVNDVLYGLNGLPENARTKLYARNPMTGEVFWSEPNFGFGSLIAVDSTLLILTDDGELVTAAADKDAFRELSRRKILEATCWTKPIYANGKIFARNDAGDLVCLALD